jgi:hypothetical protein
MQVAVRCAWFALVMFACGGAAVQSTQFRGPDGSTDWWHLHCRDSNGPCLRRAGEVCPSGYEIADREGHVGQSSASVANWGGGGGYAASSSRTTFDGEMTIRCKGPSAPAPTVDPACKSTPLLECPEQERAVRESGHLPQK